MKITLICIFWPHCDLITCVYCLFFEEELIFQRYHIQNSDCMVCLNFLLFFPETALPHYYTVILLLHVHSHTYFTYDYNFFRPFTEFHAKLNKRCRNALYFMTCFLHLKILNIFRENSSKILNMFKNIIKFYRLVKYFSDVIRRVYFLLTLLKSEIIVWFLK